MRMKQNIILIIAISIITLLGLLFNRSILLSKTYSKKDSIQIRVLPDTTIVYVDSSDLTNGTQNVAYGFRTFPQYKKIAKPKKECNQ